ncbi:MAG: hypothetical protein LDL13_01775 [Calditerrivibrio sp.]|nr:hypothetical protein [Calditerrivibrio sp.]MCA1932289.1 hypothetical protein [Calditerrivibrio sp.]
MIAKDTPDIKIDINSSYTVGLLILYNKIDLSVEIVLQGVFPFKML